MLYKTFFTNRTSKVLMEIGECVICRDEIQRENLLKPCQCKSYHVHHKCLQQWRSQNNGRKFCEICLTSYDIRCSYWVQLSGPIIFCLGQVICPTLLMTGLRLSPFHAHISVGLCFFYRRWCDDMRQLLQEMGLRWMIKFLGIMTTWYVIAYMCFEFGHKAELEYRKNSNLGMLPMTLGARGFAFTRSLILSVLHCAGWYSIYCLLQAKQVQYERVHDYSTSRRICKINSSRWIFSICAIATLVLLGKPFLEAINYDHFQK
jgi:hypothetical protein